MDINYKRAELDINVDESPPYNFSLNTVQADTNVITQTAVAASASIPITTEDKVDQETSENATIWKLYNLEAAKADAALTEGCSRGIDLLLVFTGLFSGVLTTFLVQSYQLMTPSSTDDTNALLYRLISLQANFSGIDDSFSDFSMPTDSGPSTHVLRWVNGLWFAALACSLSTALIAMLIKQWLQAYVHDISGSPRFRARQRQLRSMQLEEWRLLTVVNTLPLVLHISVLLFFAGLLVLLWSSGIGITLAAFIIVAMAYIFYFGSMWLSFFYPDCPYQHPICVHLRKWRVAGRILGRRSSSLNLSRSRDIENTNHEELGILGDSGISLVNTIMDDTIDACALIWIFTKSSNNDAAAAALKAIAGLPRDFTAFDEFRRFNAVHLIVQGFESCFYRDATSDVQWHVLDPVGASMYCRAWMRLIQGTSEQWPLNLLEPLWQLQSLENHPNSAAIASCMLALAGQDDYSAQWDLLSHLQKCTNGEIQLSFSTQSWIIDVLLESSVTWDFAEPLAQETICRVIPVLLSMLQNSRHVSASAVRSGIGLVLYSLTGGIFDRMQFRCEDLRRQRYREFTTKAFTVLAESPHHYGVEGTFLEFISSELARATAFSDHSRSIVSPSSHANSFILTTPHWSSSATEDGRIDRSLRTKDTYVTISQNMELKNSHNLRTPLSNIPTEQPQSTITVASGSGQNTISQEELDHSTTVVIKPKELDIDLPPDYASIAFRNPNVVIASASQSISDSSNQGQLTVLTSFMAGEQEKDMLKRYYTAKSAVEKAQAKASGSEESDSGGASPTVNEALYPNPLPSPSTLSPQSSPTYDSTFWHWNDSPPSFTSLPSLPEKERFRRAYEARDSADDAFFTGNNNPDLVGIILTASEEKALLRARYRDVSDQALPNSTLSNSLAISFSPSPPSPTPPTPRPPSIMPYPLAQTTLPSSMGTSFSPPPPPPPPPPIMPRPPPEYILETLEIDKRFVGRFSEDGFSEDGFSEDGFSEDGFSEEAQCILEEIDKLLGLS